MAKNLLRNVMVVRLEKAMVIRMPKMTTMAFSPQILPSNHFCTSTLSKAKVPIKQLRHFFAL